MKKLNTKKLVATALLMALIILMDVTGLGYIPVGPLKLTLFCIPVIVGTLSLGLVPGLILGLTFAVTSILKIPTNVFYATLFSGFFPFMKQVCVCLIPRLCIPVTVYYSSKFLRKRMKKQFVADGICAAIGTLTNTVLFLGLFWLLFHVDAQLNLTEELYTMFLGTFTMATTINATCELVSAVIICPPIVFAISRVFKVQDNK